MKKRDRKTVKPLPRDIKTVVVRPWIHLGVKTKPQDKVELTKPEYDRLVKSGYVKEVASKEAVK